MGLGVEDTRHTSDVLIGKIQFTVMADPAPVTPERRAQRAEALAAWLLFEWRRERQGEAA
jgi:hypothetical protein